MDTPASRFALPLHSASKAASLPFNYVMSTVPRRWWRSILGGLILTCFLGYFFMPVTRPGPLLPPLYEKYHQQAIDVSKYNYHNSPSAAEAKYVWMANQCHGVGWGNFLQEYLLDAFIVHEAGWSNVFSNYTWNKDGQDYSVYKNKNMIPSRIPLTALVAGPLVGGEWPEGDSTPISVVKEYWDKICPEEERLFIDPRQVDDWKLGNLMASDLVARWKKRLDETPGRCVEVDREAFQTGTFWIFGNAEHLLDFWPAYSTSPVLTQFRWSSLVESGFMKNYGLISSTKPAVHPYHIIPGLLALHIRRGDYREHCSNLAGGGALFNAFNSFPQFVDKFELPPNRTGELTKEVMNHYLPACLPSIQQIVAKVTEVRKTEAGKGLRNIFIMTNGAREWVTELKEALRDTEGWDLISSSRDMKLDWEQKYIAQSVDMLIGERAQVFVGNGFSSLTSNVVMFRMVRGVPPESNRFWIP